MQSLLKSERAQVYVLFAILVLSAAFGNMSQTALNAMMPHVVSEFGIPMSVGQWLTTIYMLVFGIVVPLTTYLAKRISLKNLVYIASGFSIGGLFVAILSFNFEMLFIGRVCQAIATGILLPLMQTTGMIRFSPDKRATAMGIAGIAMGVAPTAGPTLGGLMDTNFGWRSFFILLIVVAIAILIAAMLFIDPEKPLDKDAKLDGLSFTLSSLGFGGLLLAFSDASNFALESPFVWVPFILGLLCLILFVRRQKRVSDPLISMRIFSSRHYTNSFLALNTMFAAHMGIMLILSLYIQEIGGGTSLDAGLTLLPGIFAAILISPLSGYLTDHIGVRPVVITAGICFVTGSVMMVFVNESTPFFVTTIYQTIRSIGVSGLVGPLTSWGLSTLPRDIVTDGSSFTLAVRQTVASLGTSAMVFILTMSTTAGFAPMVGYQLAFGLSAALTVASFAVILVRVK